MRISRPASLGTLKSQMSLFVRKSRRVIRDGVPHQKRRLSGGSTAKESVAMHIIEAKKLEMAVFRISRAGGSNEREARLIAQNLTLSNLKGVDSHGVNYLPRYIEFLRAGGILPNRTMKVIQSADCYAVIDGQRGFGQVMGREAMRIGIEKAKAKGLAMVALRNCGHLGRIGHWAEQCAEEGLGSIYFVNVVGHDHAVATFGGKRARLGTNPLCVGIPKGPGQTPIVLDMATSAVASGRIDIAYSTRTPVEDNTLIDACGEATNDPSVRYKEPKGSLLTFGGYKGSGIAVMTEILAGIIGGGGLSQPDRLASMDTIYNQMLAFIFDPEAVTAGGAFPGFSLEQALQDYSQWIREGSKDPSHPVLLPGEREEQTHKQRMKDGIPIDRNTWERVLVAAEGVGLSRKELREITSV